MAKRRNILLKIPSVLYGWGVALRNFAFDYNLLPSYRSSIPIICVGNLSAGGSGKTPHVEWFVRQLKHKYRVAVLSRGYGRKTKGLVVATPQHTPDQIGDEPAQILRKYPDILMYIDANRRRAVRAMEALPLEIRPEVIIMDDGFQHRYIKPAYSILLTPYDNPFTTDEYLPYGNLRESAAGKFRADTIIVTSTPFGLRPIDIRLMEGQISPLAHQDYYFSRIAYAPPTPLFEDAPPGPFRHDAPIIAISGIAHPEHYHRYITSHFVDVDKMMVYPDHHDYTQSDLTELVNLLKEDDDSVLLCTEKDAIKLVRLRNSFASEVRNRIYVLSIEIDLSPESTKRILNKAEQAIKNNGLFI